MNVLPLEFWVQAVDRLAAAFREAETRLCGYDGAIGDGDHGTSMYCGFLEAQKDLRQAPPVDCGEVFRGVGRAFLDTVGGVTGVIFGSLFNSAGENAAGLDSLDAAGLHRAFAAGLAAAKMRGRASEGDKTMIDALSPAVEALRASAESGDRPHTALAKAAAAAEAGMESTVPMEGKAGRARYQPGKGTGHVDAGAASVCLVFQTLAQAAAG